MLYFIKVKRDKFLVLRKIILECKNLHETFYDPLLKATAAGL